MPDPKSESMRALASELADEHDDLDYSLASLKHFERLVRAHKETRGANLRVWGAYLGETIIRASGNVIAWGERDGQPVLVVGDSIWFPHPKIEKFLDHGSEDSPAAFADVAVALSRLASDDDVSGGFDPATISSKVRKLVEDFFRNPNTETLRAFAGARTHLVGEQFTYLLRDANAKTNVFYALFSAKPEGNGVKKWDAGRCAAREAWQLFHYELVDVAVETRRLDEMFAGKDKVARANAAFLLGRVHFERGDPSAGIAMFESGDAAVRLALLDAFWTTVVAARMDKRSIRPAEKFAPMLAAGLRGRPDQRTRALQAIQQIAIHLRADLSSVLTPVIEVLDSGKPAQIEYALRILAHHACWIMHALVPYDARIGGSIAAIIEHSKPVKGKLKVTKVQIAARYALSAYEKLGKHFDAEQRDAVERAFAAIAHVR